MSFVSLCWSFFLMSFGRVATVHIIRLLCTPAGPTTQSVSPQVLRGGKRERHGRLPRFRFAQLPAQHAAGHGGRRVGGGRGGGRHLVHGRRVGPHEAEILPRLLPGAGGGARQSRNAHPLHQGASSGKPRLLWKDAFWDSSRPFPKVDHQGGFCMSLYSRIWPACSSPNPASCSSAL